MAPPQSKRRRMNGNVELQIHSKAVKVGSAPSGQERIQQSLMLPQADAAHETSENSSSLLQPITADMGLYSDPDHNHTGSNERQDQELHRTQDFMEMSLAGASRVQATDNLSSSGQVPAAYGTQLCNINFFTNTPEFATENNVIKLNSNDESALFVNGLAQTQLEPEFSDELATGAVMSENTAAHLDAQSAISDHASADTQPDSSLDMFENLFDFDAFEHDQGAHVLAAESSGVHNALQDDATRCVLTLQTPVPRDEMISDESFDYWRDRFEQLERQLGSAMTDTAGTMFSTAAAIANANTSFPTDTNDYALHATHVPSQASCQIFLDQAVLDPRLEQSGADYVAPHEVEKASHLVGEGLSLEQTFGDAFSGVLLEEIVNSDDAQVAADYEQHNSSPSSQVLDMTNAELDAVYSIDFPHENGFQYAFKDSELQQTQEQADELMRNEANQLGLPLQYEVPSNMANTSDSPTIDPEFLDILDISATFEPPVDPAQDASVQGRRSGISFRNMKSCIDFRLPGLEVEVNNGMAYLAQELVLNRGRQGMTIADTIAQLHEGQVQLGWVSSDCTKEDDLELNDDLKAPLIYGLSYEEGTALDNSQESTPWKVVFRKYRDAWCMDTEDWYPDEAPPLDILDTVANVETIIKKANISIWARQQTSQNFLELIKACSVEQPIPVETKRIWIRPHHLLACCPMHKTNSSFAFSYPKITDPDKDYIAIIKHEAIAWLELKRDIEAFKGPMLDKYRQYETSVVVQQVGSQTQPRQAQLRLQKNASRDSLGIVTEQQFVAARIRELQASKEASDNARATRLGEPAIMAGDDDSGSAHNFSAPQEPKQAPRKFEITPSQAFEKAAAGQSLLAACTQTPLPICNAPASVNQTSAWPYEEMYMQDLATGTRLKELFDKQYEGLMRRTEAQGVAITHQEHQRIEQSAQQQAIRLHVRNMKDARYAEATRDYPDIDQSNREQVWARCENYVNSHFSTQTARMAQFQSSKQGVDKSEADGANDPQIRQLYENAVRHVETAEAAHNFERVRNEQLEILRDQARRKNQLQDAKVLENIEIMADSRARINMRYHDELESLFQQARAEGRPLTPEFRQELQHRAKNRTKQAMELPEAIHQLFDTLKARYASANPDKQLSSVISARLHKQAEIQAHQDAEMRRKMKDSFESFNRGLREAHVDINSSMGRNLHTLWKRNWMLNQWGESKFRRQYENIVLAAVVDGIAITKEFQQEHMKSTRERHDLWVKFNERVFEVCDESEKVEQKAGPISTQRHCELTALGRKQVFEEFSRQGASVSTLSTPVSATFNITSPAPQNGFESPQGHLAGHNEEEQATQASDTVLSPTHNSQVSPFSGHDNGSHEDEADVTVNYSRPGTVGWLDGNVDSPTSKRSRKTTASTSSKTASSVPARKRTTAVSDPASVQGMAPPPVPAQKAVTKTSTKRKTNSKAAASPSLPPSTSEPNSSGEPINLISPSPEPETSKAPVSKTAKDRAAHNQSSLSTSGYTAPQYKTSSTGRSSFGPQPLGTQASEAPKATVAAPTAPVSDTPSRSPQQAQNTQIPVSGKYPPGMSPSRRVHTVTPGSPMGHSVQINEASAQLSQHQSNLQQNGRASSQAYGRPRSPSQQLQSPYPLSAQERQVRNVQRQAQLQSANRSPTRNILPAGDPYGNQGFYSKNKALPNQAYEQINSVDDSTKLIPQRNNGHASPQQQPQGSNVRGLTHHGTPSTPYNTMSQRGTQNEQGSVRNPGKQVDISRMVQPVANNNPGYNPDSQPPSQVLYNQSVQPQTAQRVTQILSQQNGQAQHYQNAQRQAAQAQHANSHGPPRVGQNSQGQNMQPPTHSPRTQNGRVQSPPINSRVQSGQLQNTPAGSQVDYFSGSPTPFPSPKTILTPQGQHQTSDARASSEYKSLAQQPPNFSLTREFQKDLPTKLLQNIGATVASSPSPTGGTPKPVVNGTKRKATQDDLRRQSLTQAQAQAQAHSDTRGDNPSKRPRPPMAPTERAAYDQKRAEHAASKAAADANVKRMEAEEGARHRQAVQHQQANEQRSRMYERTVKRFTSDIPEWQWGNHGISLQNQRHSMPSRLGMAASVRSGTVSNAGMVQGQAQTPVHAHSNGQTQTQNQAKVPEAHPNDNVMDLDQAPISNSFFAREMSPERNLGFLDEGQTARFDGAHGESFKGASSYGVSWDADEYQSYGRIVEAQKPSQQQLKQEALKPKTVETMSQERAKRLAGMAGYGWAYSHESQSEVMVKVPIVPKGLRKDNA